MPDIIESLEEFVARKHKELTDVFDAAGKLYEAAEAIELELTKVLIVDQPFVLNDTHELLMTDNFVKDGVPVLKAFASHAVRRYKIELLARDRKPRKKKSTSTEPAT